MKYFVLHTLDSGFNMEYYLKGKSFNHIEERIKKYSNGILSTSKWTLVTGNINLGFLREVQPKEFPNLKKQDFATINENHSFSFEEMGNITPF
jgi:hypothetical protein